MLTPIAGRSVIVTGASRGIGRGIASLFARHGGSVLLVARDGAAAEEAASALREAGGAASACEADVTKETAMARMAEMAVARHGGIDILIANAGIFPSAPLAAMSEAAFDAVMATNLKGTFLAVRAVLPVMRKQRKGRIVITSSITGPVTGYPGWSHYGASKAAQLGFMRTAAIELAPDGITINAVLPGNIVTEGLDALGADYLTRMARAIPLGRLGSVADVANAALFLASDEAGYITGQTLIVDGGQTLPESLDALSTPET
ncbi:MAG TPA: 3-oxoacyl-ACP reductase FabG [Acetobacteraceae bacterium]|nr:3-oxoacyl-ACP reductase FabG [Acetobacteraceae bacterium]